jgi:hypothetical protein
MLFVSLRRLRSWITDWFCRDHPSEPARPVSGRFAERRGSKASFDPYATLTHLTWLPDSPEPQEPSTRSKGR